MISSSVQFFDLIVNADLMTKIILGILVLFSLISWSIIFDKLFKFRLLELKTSQFEKLFWSGQLLEDIYKKTKTGHKYPSAYIFNAAMQEWENTNILEIVQTNDIQRKDTLKGRIYDMMNVALNKSIIKLRYGLGFLSICASTATLFGLLGTVCGIMSTFQAVSITQNASLTTIAPGLTSALITTVAGLLTALPAIIAYYVYKNRISSFEVEMENFELEILTILSRELD